MNSREVAEILDQLSHAEQRSLMPRLRESIMFVSWASSDEAEAVDDMIREEREHIAWLIELINDLDESPTPCIADVRTTSLHYVALDYLMPRIIEDKSRLVRRYEQSAPRLAEHPQASALVAHILDRHRQHLKILEDLVRQYQHTASAAERE